MRGIPPLSEREKTTAIIKAVIRATDMWQLTDSEAATIFNVSTTTWHRMKSGNYNGVLNQDKITRASLIIGIFKDLKLLFNGPLTMNWPKTKNKGKGFDGRSPVEVMQDGGIPAMIHVRQHIDALRGD